MITRFLIYGLIGWCMEIIWTGLISLSKRNFRLTSSTSIWMFFIYGLIIFMEPVFNLLAAYPVIVRGGVYVLCFFAAEFLTGAVMKRFNSCPWDYSEARYNVAGVIRLDYAPVWFAAGLIFEFVHFILIAI